MWLKVKMCKVVLKNWYKEYEVEKDLIQSCRSNLVSFNGRNRQELSSDIGSDCERQKLKIEIPKK